MQLRRFEETSNEAHSHLKALMRDKDKRVQHKAIELWTKVPHLNTESQVERSRALALLAGLGGNAKSGVTATEARTFADQSVAALAAVVQLGWGYPSELKEPDFDVLRGRADFQKLVAEVEGKTEK